MNELWVSCEERDAKKVSIQRVYYPACWLCFGLWFWFPIEVTRYLKSLNISNGSDFLSLLQAGFNSLFYGYLLLASRWGGSRVCRWLGVGFEAHHEETVNRSTSFSAGTELLSPLRLQWNGYNSGGAVTAPGQSNSLNVQMHEQGITMNGQFTQRTVVWSEVASCDFAWDRTIFGVVKERPYVLKDEKGKKLLTFQPDVRTENFIRVALTGYPLAAANSALGE